MDGLEKEYYDELKKNTKLVMINDILKKLDKKNINFKLIKNEMHKKLVYIQNNIKRLLKPGNEDEIYNFLYTVFDINNYIFAVLIAFDKNIYTGSKGTIHNEDYKLYAPHVYKGDDGLKIYDVDINDYTLEREELWYNLFESRMVPFQSKLMKTDIIIHSFPIIVYDKFYGMFAYSFELQKLNKICRYL